MHTDRTITCFHDTCNWTGVLLILLYGIINYCFERYADYLIRKTTSVATPSMVIFIIIIIHSDKSHLFKPVSNCLFYTCSLINHQNCAANIFELLLIVRSGQLQQHVCISTVAINTTENFDSTEICNWYNVNTITYRSS